MDYSVQTMGIMYLSVPVADPGFPVSGGGGGAKPFGGHQPPKRALFGENMCNNEKIGSRWGGAPLLDPPMSTYQVCFNVCFKHRLMLYSGWYLEVVKCLRRSLSLIVW